MAMVKSIFQKTNMVISPPDESGFCYKKGKLYIFYFLLFSKDVYMTHSFDKVLMTDFREKRDKISPRKSTKKEDDGGVKKSQVK